MTVVDTLVIKPEYKDEAYRNAVEYLEDCLMVRQSHFSVQIIRHLDTGTGLPDWSKHPDDERERDSEHAGRYQLPGRGIQEERQTTAHDSFRRVARGRLFRTQ